MILIRSARRSDYRALLRLSGHLNSYNLPADASAVREILKLSVASFRGKIRDKTRAKYVFVAEDRRTGQVVGCSLIIARHGTRAMPHLSLRLGMENKTSRFLGRRVVHTTLKLHSDPRGYTEVGGLVVLPAYRRRTAKIGRQLSSARFAYMARYPGRFQRRLLVEYLPVLDRGGGNRFWKALGRKFTRLSYAAADRLSARSKEFILSLYPRQKLYGCFLPDSVVRNLGAPGEGAKVSVRLLEKMGFRFLRQIDPFDGGPHYGALLKKVTLIRNAQTKIFEAAVKEKRLGKHRGFLAAEIRGEIRALVSRYGCHGRKVFLPAETARLLGIRRGNLISVMPWR